MNVGFNIPIHKNSRQYIIDTLGSYEAVDSMKLIENPIIHMYAKEDTLDLETGELNGYTDSLFSEYHFYDTKAMKVFRSKRFHDAIYFDSDVHVSNVKLFKDGSTLVQLSNGLYEISNGQAVHIYRK
ncbi:hypothetical protein [Bacillus sp. AG4(2022)]|uniref:hypothetical protein n=1 Tax=Bacillus sp. AG4(2022) TaxID=2962594 RepID=UPI0028821CA7|nr:hypothetical protein [Bacillus sp. AG4(2022)]MDT0160423.1 hypothetical protein [Bacillus sp. AG4(2022)]